MADMIFEVAGAAGDSGRVSNRGNIVDSGRGGGGSHGGHEVGGEVQGRQLSSDVAGIN